jgi:hypothetical protein
MWPRVSISKLYLALEDVLLTVYRKRRQLPVLVSRHLDYKY